MINSISHITFIVKDVQRTAELLRVVFDAREVYDGAGKSFSTAYEKFFLIGDIWIAIMEGDPLTERTYNHVAFNVSEDDFDDYTVKVKKLGLETLSGRSRVRGEGRSLYFYDHDNHLFELHTGTLIERLVEYEADISADRK